MCKMGTTNKEKASMLNDNPCTEIIVTEKDIIHDWGKLNESKNTQEVLEVFYKVYNKTVIKHIPGVTINPSKTSQPLKQQSVKKTMKKRILACFLRAKR